MKKAIGILALFLLFVGVTAMQSEAAVLQETTYKTIGGSNTEILPSSVVYLRDGNVLGILNPQTGTFQRFTPLEKWRFVDGKYVENIGTQVPVLGFGYLNDWDNYDLFVATDGGKRTAYVTNEKVGVEPDNGVYSTCMA